MRGVITRWDVLANCFVIWREFGLVCLLRCFKACLEGKSTTFLDVALKR